MEFEIGTLSIILIVGLLALIAIGVPMGFASGFMGAVLVFLYIGEHALGILLSRYYSLVVTYSFLSVPLFIFMASLLERSNIARDLYDALNAWLRKTRGGVGVVTAIMATIMAAMSGIIGGEIVLLGLIALPQMLRLKYDQDMSIGIICASGSLGTMIPPSIVLIIYGLTTETSITMLFQEAIVPGLMILGSIYSGITGITEAAGMGVVATLIIIGARKELTWFLFKDALVRTFKASGTILTITFGATVLAGAYSLAGGPTYVAETILAYDLKPMYLIFMMQVMFLIMGAFMDWVGIVLLAMPVFLPIVLALGFDPIWFGILFCVNMQVSFLSPPFGPAAFYLKSVAPPHISLTDIFRGFAPFVVIQLIVLACVMYFPEAMTQNFHEFVPKK